MTERSEGVAGGRPVLGQSPSGSGQEPSGSPGHPREGGARGKPPAPSGPGSARWLQRVEGEPGPLPRIPRGGTPLAGPGPALAGAGLALCGFLGGTPKREIATDCARGRSQGPSVPGRARPRGCRGKDPAQVGVEETASRTRGGARRRRQALGRVSTEQVRTESGARIQGGRRVQGWPWRVPGWPGSGH